MSTPLAWKRWGDDRVDVATGIRFDQTPADRPCAPPSKFRVCAYHLDFDERPTCYVDVDSLVEAERITGHLRELCDYNVDFAVAYDDAGERVTKPTW